MINRYASAALAAAVVLAVVLLPSTSATEDLLQEVLGQMHAAVPKRARKQPTPAAPHTRIMRRATSSHVCARALVFAGACRQDEARACPGHRV
jgi:hypothetical protein